MTNRLFVSVDPTSGGIDEAALFDAMKLIGGITKISSTLYFVTSGFTAEQATRVLHGHVNGSPIVVINALTAQVSYFNVPPAIEELLGAQWNQTIGKS